MPRNKINKSGQRSRRLCGSGDNSRAAKVPLGAAAYSPAAIAWAALPMAMTRTTEICERSTVLPGKNQLAAVELKFGLHHTGNVDGRQGVLKYAARDGFGVWHCGASEASGLLQIPLD